MENLFIATPSHSCKRYCANEFTQALKEHAPQAYKSIIFNSTGRILFGGENEVFQSVSFLENATDLRNKIGSIHERIVQSAQKLREQFLAGKWEYYLSLESDVILNELTIPLLFSLARTYPDCNVFHTECYTSFHPKYENNPQRVHRLTMGCTLIHRDIIKDYPFRYDPLNLAAHYDALFAMDLNNNNVPIIYDANIVLEHRENRTTGRGWIELPRSEKG